ncbi:MAG: 50S ribosome-binding GTPase [Actinobacteria bacterium]|nr:50S ribosome-binding GTPase [Actinomycetota bacterium]MCL5446047.1 50S ribosome-binding GTPase [Actinomycetota bacterium]
MKMPPELGRHSSGFLLVTLIGRPNAGKSTLVNVIAGWKVSITSSRPSTTRRSQYAKKDLGELEVVFVDTPGMHQPKSELGKKMAQHTEDALDGADVIMLVFDASRPATQGDRIVMARAMKELAASRGRSCALRIVVNKIDKISKAATVQALAAYYNLAKDTAKSVAKGLDGRAPQGTTKGAADVVPPVPRARSVISQYDIEIFPVSALKGAGVTELMESLAYSGSSPTLQPAVEQAPVSRPDAIYSLLPISQGWDTLQSPVPDISQEYYVAELVREQVLRRVADELPYSVACRIAEWHPPYIACDIVVERKSQKAIILGKGGTRLRDIGIGARNSLPAGTYLDLAVKVVPHWQDTPEMFEQMGY